MCKNLKEEIKMEYPLYVNGKEIKNLAGGWHFTEDYRTAFALEMLADLKKEEKKIKRGKKMIKTLALILTMCLTLNACDSLLGIPQDVHYLSKAEKKHEKTERKRHERLLISNAEEYQKNAAHYKAQAEALAKKVNDLDESCDYVAGWCTVLFITSVSLAGYICYDKCCSPAAIEAKAKALKSSSSGFEPF